MERHVRSGGEGTRTYHQAGYMRIHELIEHE
jgi:hypothetical protein